MSKSGKKTGGKGKGGTRRGKKAFATGPMLETIILIGKGNVINNPTALSCLPDGPVMWIVKNKDTVPHTVTIDPANFVNTDTGKKAHPFKGNGAPIVWTVNGNGGTATFPDSGALPVIKSRGNFSKFPTPFKYEIESSNADGTKNGLDPDLDVIDPGARPNG